MNTPGGSRAIRSHRWIACDHLEFLRKRVARVLGIFESPIRIPNTLGLFDQIVEVLLERSHLLNFLILIRLKHWELALLVLIVLKTSILNHSLALISLHDYVDRVFCIG